MGARLAACECKTDVHRAPSTHSDSCCVPWIFFPFFFFFFFFFFCSLFSFFFFFFFYFASFSQSPHAFLLFSPTRGLGFPMRFAPKKQVAGLDQNVNSNAHLPSRRQGGRGRGSALYAGVGCFLLTTLLFFIFCIILTQDKKKTIKKSASSFSVVFLFLFFLSLVVYSQ